MMRIHHTDYVELPVPLSVTRERLHDHDIWLTLPTGGKPVGHFWHWGDDLYTIDVVSDTVSQDHFCWTIVSQANPAITLQVEMTLHDFVLSTHAIVHVTLTLPGMIWPWQQLLYRHRLVTALRGCTTALARQLRRRVAVVSPAPTVSVPMHVGAMVSVGGGGNAPVEAPLTPASPLADRLRPYYPKTVEHFETMGALDHLERVWRLERSWERILRGEYESTVYQPWDQETLPLHRDMHQTDYDLIYAGGGLGLIHATVMACRYGWRVMVFDRSEVGCAHREWNISRTELQNLVDTGVVTWDDLAPVIMREYRSGLVSFHQSPYSQVDHHELWMDNVLNLAIDAGAILRLMRRKLEAAGGILLDHRTFRCVRVTEEGPLRVAVELESVARRSDGSTTPLSETYTARLLLDGMGSVSPLALMRHQGDPFAGVCPTVGTVARGFVQGTGPRELDSTIGDILISVADIQTGRQFIWEGFPGRNDELTTYVFYYAALRGPHAKHRSTMHAPRCDPHPPPGQPIYSLLELFEIYFDLLPTYKQPGPDFQHIKPVYGYIPGRHSVNAQEAPLLRGVLPVGDSAAQQSPLTYCGFGSHIRNIQRTTSLLDYALHHDLLEPKYLERVSPFQINVSLNWVFSRFMQPWGQPHNVNEIQNAFLGALDELGHELAIRFFQDQMRWDDYNKIVWQMLLRYWIILAIPWKVLGPSGVRQWVTDYGRFSLATATARLARLGGNNLEQLAYGVSDRLSPQISLRLRSLYAEWRVMKWLA
ncbi:MAG: hypothetical protein HC837_05080 [Chloroflexaceae bacterium]|nr:hypothetical protein [Chloroflexaceae bacterium]